MSEASTAYRDAWLSVIYDATGDYVKAKRAMELAELNGLFDPIEAASGGFVVSVEEFDRIVNDLQNPGEPSEGAKRGAELLRRLYPRS